MKRYLSAILIGLLGITASAYAAQSETSTQNELPWYAGLQLGQSSADIPSTINFNKTNVPGLPSTTVVTLPVKSGNTSGVSYRLFVGKNVYHAGANSFAIEGGYLQLGQVKLSGNFADITPSRAKSVGNIGVTADTNGFDLLGAWNYQLSPKFYLLGKLGLASLNLSIKTTSTNDATAESSSTSINKILPELVLGGGFNFNTHFSAQLTAAKLFGTAIPDNISDLTDINTIPPFMVYSLGVTYTFA